MKKIALIISFFAASITFASTVQASNFDIKSAEFNVVFNANGEQYSILRDQYFDLLRIGDDINSARICPPFCEQQIALHPKVQTVEELELFEFLVNYVNSGKGVLIDARPEGAYVAGTIPGSVNLPHKLFAPSPQNAFYDSVMVLLGGEKSDLGEWSFTDAQDLMLYCDGQSGKHAADAVRNLLLANYPPEKLHFYRGGMISWTAMGLTTTLP